MVEIAAEVRWQDRRARIPVERIRLCEELGFDAIFTAGGYGSEELVELGYLAALTTRMKIGTRITEVTARAPAVAAMAFRTLDHLTGGGRVIAGLGSGSPGTAEGLQGRPWGRPLSRMRDFVTIMRQVLDGEVADHQGVEWSAPYRGPGARDVPPAAIGLEPLGEIPVMIAAAGPRMTALAAEIGDGWMPPGWAPGIMPVFEPLLQAGFDRATDGRSLATFPIWGHVDMNVHDDVREAMRPFKEYVVTWSQLQHPFMAARGYPELSATLGAIIAEATEAGAAENARARAVAGRPMLDEPYWQRALDAVPDEYIDEGWLVGPVRRIQQRVAPWLDCGLSGVVFRYGHQLTHGHHVEDLDAFRAVAAAAGRAPAL